MKHHVSLFLCVILLAAVAGCGSGKRLTLPQADANHPEANFNPAFETTLAKINAAPVPDGIDQELFKRLTSELGRVILENSTGQIAQHPPKGTANRVRGFSFAQDTPGSWEIRWDYLNVGDYDQNGEVGISDLTPLGVHFGKSGPFEPGSIESLVDGDGNGQINLSDITPIGVNYQACITSYNLYGSDDPLDCPTAWNGANGPGAQLLGSVETAAVLEAAAGRAVFSMAVDPPEAGRSYWVRPADGIAEGSASLNGGVNSWSQSGHDARNTRCSPYRASQTGTLKWTYQSTGPTDYCSDPAIGGDGSIYFGTRTGMHALNADGSSKWRAGPHELVFDAAIAPDGTVYASTYSKGLYAYKPDGTIKWHHEADNWNTTAPSFAPDSTAYLGTNDNNVTAFSTNGQVRWEFETVDAVDATPVVAADGTILAVCDDHKLYAINPDGTKRWTYQMDGAGYYSPLLGSAGRIYAASADKLYALDISGVELWTYQFAAKVRSSATEGTDGNIYVCVDDLSLVAVSPDGTYQWTCSFDDQPRYGAAVGQDGTIFVSSLYQMYAVNADGTNKWSFKPEHFFNGAPVLGADGVIYAGGSDDLFYAINQDGSLSWTYGPGAFITSPTIAADGTLFARTDRRLHALNPDGTLKWFHDGHYYLSSLPVVAMDGSVYMSDHMGFLYSLKQDGSLKWESDWYNEYYVKLLQADDGTLYADRMLGILAVFDPDGTILVNENTLQGYNGAMALSADGILYVGRQWSSTQLAALDANCQQVWTYDCNADVIAVGPTGTIYTTDYSALLALNPEGTLKWSLPAGQETGGLAIAPDETLYLATYENIIVAINPNGTEKWRFQAKLPDEEGVTACCSAPAVGADGLVYFGSTEMLYCLDPQMNEVWTHTLPDDVAWPTIGADGTVYVGCSDGKLYAFGD